MNLKNITLSYPVIRYKVDVTHFTARNSTAMEWLILEITRKAMEDTQLEGVPIASVFEDVFRINDADYLVKPCILSLRDGGAMIAEDIYDGTSLRDVPLRNLRLTEDGRKMQQDGLLPGKISSDVVTVAFDPMRQELINEKKYEDYGDYATGIHVREIENPSDETFPVALVMEYLTAAKQKKQYRWMSQTTNIHEAVPIEAALLWKNVSRKVSVGTGWVCQVVGDEDGSLADMALDEIESDFSEQHVDAPAIDALDPDADITQLIEPMALQGHIENLEKSDALFAVNRRHFTESVWSDEGKKLKGLRIAIVEEDEKAEVVLSGNHLLIRIPDRLLDNGMLYLSGSTSVSIGLAHLRSTNSTKDIVLAYIPVGDSHVRCSNMVDSLIEKYAAKYPRLFYLLLEIGAKDRFYQKVREVTELMDSLEQRQTYLDTINREGMQIYGKRLLTPEQYSEFLLNREEIKDSLNSISDVGKIVYEYSTLEVFHNNDELLRNVTRIALEECPEAKSAEDLQQLWKQIQSVKKSLLQWINNSKLYARFYTPDILEQIAKSFTITGESVIEGVTQIEETYLELERVPSRVLRRLRELDVDADCSTERVRECVLLHREELSALHSEVRNWDDAVGNYERRIGTLEEAESISPAIRKAVLLMDRLRDTLSIFFDESAVKFPNVFIVDTCALMNRPELISTFEDGKALLIVPVLVQDELDHLKEDDNEDRMFQARDAIRQIEAYRTFDWLDNTQNSCPELLSSDMDSERNDNKILSIAIKYIYKNAVLITDDTNLRNLASSQNVKSMNSEGYMQAKLHEKTEASDKKKKGKKKGR